MTTSKVNFVFKTLVFALAIFFLGEANAQIRTLQAPKTPQLSKQTVQKLKNYIPCPDLKADKVDFEIIREKTSHILEVRVTGVIKNVGSQTYTSGANQQSINLYLDRTLMMQRKTGLTSLAPGATASVSFVTEFYKNNEFPPTAKVVISYDPDIKNDGNSMNDDCRNANNSLSRSMADVNNIPYLRSSTTVNKTNTSIRTTK